MSAQVYLFDHSYAVVEVISLSQWFSNFFQKITLQAPNNFSMAHGLLKKVT